MDLHRRTLLRGTPAASLLGAAWLAGCTSSSGSSSGASSASTASATGASVTTSSLAFDDAAWSYDATNDVYYQLGRSYLTKPAAPDYETLAVVVPGAYLKGVKNTDGTYTATVSSTATVGGFTARTAPIVLPVNTPGYAAQKPLTAYSYGDVSAYLKAGFVYVHAGLRGRDSNTTTYTGNAPWGVTDLKAAVRYLRYNADVLPGDPDRVFVFGHSGGGAQSAVLGASGDSELFTPYLTSLGAALEDTDGTALSDAVAGAMCWCPITSLDYADAAYEWNMGQFATTGTRAAGTWTEAYSKDLAASFARHVNTLGLKDSAGTKLALRASDDGVYLAGSYYDHLVKVVEASLDDFLNDTTFPYTPSSSFMAGVGAGAPSEGAPAGSSAGSSAAASSSATATTYATVQTYLDHLNSAGTWVTYDAATRTATVTGLEGFVKSQKSASKGVGAFDAADRSATENVVLGRGAGGLHFSPVSRDVLAANGSRYAKLSGWTSTYAASAYTSDFATTDTVGKDVTERLDLYNPMYYVSRSYRGFRSSTVAPHWRIRTGIMQGDTASTVEINLALALQNYGIGDVDFATVWGQGHTMAERTGDGSANFITWVKERVALSGTARVW